MVLKKKKERKNVLIETLRPVGPPICAEQKKKRFQIEKKSFFVNLSGPSVQT